MSNRIRRHREISDIRAANKCPHPHPGHNPPDRRTGSRRRCTLRSGTPCRSAQERGISLILGEKCSRSPESAEFGLGNPKSGPRQACRPRSTRRARTTCSSAISPGAPESRLDTRQPNALPPGRVKIAASKIAGSCRVFTDRRGVDATLIDRATPHARSPYNPRNRSTAGRMSCQRSGPKSPSGISTRQSLMVVGSMRSTLPASRSSRLRGFSSSAPST